MGKFKELNIELHEKFQASEEYEAAYQEWLSHQQVVPLSAGPQGPTGKYLCTVESIDLGELGEWDCSFYGRSNYEPAEPEVGAGPRYNIHVESVQIIGLGTYPHYTIVPRELLHPKVAQRLDTETEEHMLSEANK